MRNKTVIKIPRYKEIPALKTFSELGLLPDEIVFGVISEFLHKGHTNSIYKDWQSYKKTCLKICYGCNEVVALCSKNDIIHNDAVCNTIIFERSHLKEIHFVVLCYRCMVINQQLNQIFKNF